MDLAREALALLQPAGLVLAGGQLGLGFAQLLGDVPVVRRLCLQPPLDEKDRGRKGGTDKRSHGRSDGPALGVQPGGNECRCCPQHGDGNQPRHGGQSTQKDKNEREFQPHEILRMHHQAQPQEA